MLAHSTDSTRSYLEVLIFLLCCIMLSFFCIVIEKYRNFIINFAVLVRYFRV